MMSQTANNLISVWGIEYIEEMRIYCQLKNGIIGNQISPTPLGRCRLSPLHISPSLCIHLPTVCHSDLPSLDPS